MVSDVFADAVVDLDSYLNNELFDDTYDGETRERIIRIRVQMEAMRMVLDGSWDFWAAMAELDRRGRGWLNRSVLTALGPNGFAG